MKVLFHTRLIFSTVVAAEILFRSNFLSASNEAVEEFDLYGNKNSRKMKDSVGMKKKQKRDRQYLVEK